MSRFRNKDSYSWLEVVAGLLAQDKAAPRFQTRRLAAEQLEHRTVLSTAAVAAPAAAEGESLAQYLARDQQMGPIAPPSESATTADIDAAAEPGVQDAASAPLTAAPADQFFGTYAGAGVGEGEGSGSGSGSGSGAPTVADTTTTTENGTTTLSGQITDDGGTGNLTVSYDGPGTLTIDEYGNFVVDLGSPEESGTATITITDANGQTTSYSFPYGPS